MRGNVVPIRRGSADQTMVETSTGYPAATVPIVAEASYSESSYISTGEELTPRQLYSDKDLESRLLKAVDVTERARLCLQEALKYDPREEFVYFDQEVMKARALIATAFGFRAISDGYAAVVNAVNWALANRKPGEPSRRQINVISVALERVIAGPLMHFDTAMQVIDEMEEADLDVESPAIDILTSHFDEQ